MQTSVGTKLLKHIVVRAVQDISGRLTMSDPQSDCPEIFRIGLLVQKCRYKRGLQTGRAFPIFYTEQMDAAVLGDRLPEVTQMPFLGSSSLSLQCSIERARKCLQG